MQQNIADVTGLIETIHKHHGANELMTVSAADAGQASLLVLPTGRAIHDVGATVEKYLPRPRRLVEHARLGGTDAVVEYAQRFKTADSALFFNPDPDAPWLKLVVDYHSRTADADAFGPAQPTPAHRSHTGTYQFPLSDEMTAWLAAEKRGLMDAEDFAWLLQARENDISNPPVDWMLVPQEDVERVCTLLNLRDDHRPKDGNGNPIPWEELGFTRDAEELPTGYRTRLDKLRAKRFGTQLQLLTLSQEMSVSTTSSAKQQIRVQDGTRYLEIAEDHQANVRGQKIKVPELFLIDIPVFDGEPSHLMPVRLFYRRAGNGVKWAVELVDHRRMVKDAIAKAARSVATATGLPLINGDPFAKAA